MLSKPKRENKAIIKSWGQNYFRFHRRKMVAVEELDEIIIGTNDNFPEYFENWIDQANYDIKLIVINECTLSNEDRLGALGDIQHVINTVHVHDDLMIVAGDNLFGISFS